MSVEELVKRLRHSDEYEPLGHDGWEAADKLEELAAENGRLRRELSATTAERKRAQEACQQISEKAEPAPAQCKHPVWGQDKDGTRVCAKCGLVEHPAARSGAVKVKALEWVENAHGIFVAKTAVGAYEVGFDDGWWSQLDSASTWEWEPEQDPRSYYGPSAAQAAAQSDYERRILAAIETAEPATDTEPFTYFYRYSDPMSGKAVWRSSGGLWNGQRPSETLPLYTRPPEPATDAEAVAWLCEDQIIVENRSVTLDGEFAAYRAKYSDAWKITPLFTRPPESRLREALEGLLEVHEALGAGNSYAAKKARAALAQEDGR